MRSVSIHVGIRELRQHLRRYLQAAREGKTFFITEHGAPIALLAPLPAPTHALDRLIAAGKATAPRGNLSDITPVLLPSRDGEGAS